MCRSEHGHTAIHTKLGWVLSGPTLVTSPLRCSVNLVITHVLQVDAQEKATVGLEQLQSFWDLELPGIQEVKKMLYDNFASNITFSQGHYQVAFPWKEFHNTLPDPYQLSLERLHGLLRRFRQNPAILGQYDHTIKKQLQRGIIEAVDETKLAPGKVHYFLQW